MKKILCCFLFSSLFSTSNSQTIHYVKQGASGDGSTWAKASGDMQEMINISAPGDQVWVANGTYSPTHRADNMSDADPDDRNNAFAMKKDVKVFGSFDGTETSPSQRYIPIQFPFHDRGTVLIGNMNYYHLVISAGEAGTAELNGFFLYQGWALDSGIDGEINLPGVDAPIQNGDGGGIYIDASNITLSNLTIYNCESRYRGGALLILNSSPTLLNVDIFRSGSSNGGAIYNSYSSPSLTNVSIRACDSPIGAAIFNDHSSPVITNCVISGCDAGFNGASGISNSNSSPVLTNVTMTGNRGQGIINSNSSVSIIRNSIIHHNSNSIKNDVTSSAQIEYSLVEYEAGGTNGNLPGTTKPLMYDFLSGAVGAFVQGDWELQLGSPLLNKGNNSYYDSDQIPDLSGITTDLGHHPRIQNGIIDIGAYEGYHVVPEYGKFITYVTPTGSGNFSGNSWGNATADLQNAINALGAREVWVAEGTYKPIYRADDEDRILPTNDDPDNAFVLHREVKVYGGFTGTETKLIQRDSTLKNHLTILSGEIGIASTSSDNARHLVISSGQVGSAEVNSIIIKDGYGYATGSITVNSNTVERNYGGGICNISSSPILANLEINNNQARFGGGGMYNLSSNPILTKVTILENNGGALGGGMFNKLSSPVLNDMTLTQNIGTSGGGMYNSSSSNPVLNKVTISQNQALKGGGIYNSSSSPVINYGNIYFNSAQNGAGMYNTGSSPVLTGVELISNTADQKGGGIFNISSSNPVLKDLIISSNQSTSDGGGIYNSSSSPQLVNVALALNVSSTSGGGMYNYDGSSPAVTNAVFSENTANQGGGMANENSSPQIINVSFQGNQAFNGNGGGIYSQLGSTATIANSLFWNNTATALGADLYDDGSTSAVTYSYTQSSISGTGNIMGAKDPFINISNPIGIDFTWGTDDDGLHLNETEGYFASGFSPINAGNDAAIPTGITTDMTGALRVQKGWVDMGAYESISGTLPVTLMNFNGTLSNSQAHLQWQTGEENNFNHFEIKRSTDSRTFSSIGKVFAKGSNSTYDYFTPQSQTIAYYRLKIVDNDGRFSYSDIKSLSQSEGLTQVYPNPAKEEIRVKVATAGLLRIYNAAGKLEKTQTLQEGVNIINVSTLGAGLKFCAVGDERLGFMKE